ncbi:Disease resistance protein L6 [Linum perenne]
MDSLSPKFVAPINRSESFKSSSFSATTFQPALPAGEYEVFLSFRGPDVRFSFADCLYSCLVRSKIRTFRDEEELRKGEQISPSLVQAIIESKIHIPIFSQNYASSKWCLQELAKMVECWKQGKGNIILPIFYFVNPRDVRHQDGPYKQAFELHARKHDADTVKEWREALQEVGKMKGWTVKDYVGQGAIINEVFSRVDSFLMRNYKLVADQDLVGVDFHVEQVVKLLDLDSQSVTVVSIHGIGGSGKTTISKAVYDKVCSQFDRCCFLEDVRETLKKNEGVVNLQNKVLSVILKHDYPVENASNGIHLIKDRVCKYRVLIVLDDIDDKFEFHKIMGNMDDFSFGSKFMITTRESFLYFHKDYKSYEVGEMSHDHSLQLFCKHAFRMDYPPEDYAILSSKFVEAAAGLPLALKVMGSLLFRKDMKIWEENLIRFKEIPPCKVQERLKISYDALTYEEQQIFLDIACLFIGEDKRLPIYMWGGCNFYPESGIDTLVLRSLIKINESSRFWMHDHIRDLGRAIVRDEGVENPGKRSRIWSGNDALNILKNNQVPSMETSHTESSSSKSSSDSSSALPVGEYEVFLSFRGPDVRKTFADHLYTCLVRSKILTFRDDEELRKGEKISTSIVQAITLSKIHIPVFSENYASSKWCLQEIAKMVECWKQRKGHVILPIFYFVNPRDVRHQEGSYKEAFDLHRERYDDDTVNEWREALREVGNMKGWTVSDSDGQGAVIDDIVSQVDSHLMKNYKMVAEDLVGVDFHVGEVMKLLDLESKMVRSVSIHGIGGIGKTTLAKAVYDNVSTHFDRCCFVEGVRETITKNEGVVTLQSKVISSILREDCLVENASRGIHVIQNRVCKHRVLIVLDDVDDTFEVDKILGKIDDFSPGSRFMFTTRDKVLNLDQECELYELGEMSSFCSLQLFSKHAFGTHSPPEDYVSLSNEFVEVAVGLPLALKVIGSLLFRKNKRVWEEKLMQLKEVPASKVQERLKISYDALLCEEQQIFLDIACFFIGENKELPVYMWNDCKLYPESGVNALVLRSLIKINERNEFWMHDHIRDLGRAIVHNENVQHPCKRSRIWSNDEAFDMLNNREMAHMLKVITVSGCYVLKRAPDLSECRSLELLNLRNCWKMSGELHIGNLKYLKELNIGCNKLSEVTGFEGLDSLQELSIHGCTSITVLSDLSFLRKLNRLSIEGCTQLIEVAGIESLQHLQMDKSLIERFCNRSKFKCLLREIINKML